ncbi:hypothetical protein FACS1894110_22780 [Spirochaetia bacterium]|nr:hypothetical protein FACS1894110_22780 [Spirochaetia bacterium]
MISRIIDKIFIGILVIFLLPFVFDIFTSFDIKHQIIKNIIYFGIIILTGLNIVKIILIKNKQKRHIIFILFLIIIFISEMILTILYLNDTWKTQTRLYENNHLKNYFIELQMQDIGNFGYRSRKVKVIYLTKYFMIINPAKENYEEKLEWKKINMDINEMGLEQW